MRRILLALALLAACKQERSKLDETTPQPAAATATAPGAPAAAADGTVAETMDSGGYTYARVDRGGTSTWYAGPETKLAVGAKLGMLQGSLMQNFRSDTLNRTFPEIYFVNSWGTPAAATASANPHADQPATEQPTPGPQVDLSGVVVQTINASTYTYVQIDHNGTKLWLAGPETKLATGAQLGKMTGTLMPKFHSDTLNRTFDEIYFVNQFNVAADAIPNPHSGSGAPAKAEPPMEKIAQVAGGTSVADVIAKKDALVGKPVVVKGKVVKLNNGILGRNWYHLRDGTGAPGANDLLVTTDVAVTTTVGAVVVARGTIATHQDFGSGYKYDVILEKATLAEK